MIRLTIPALATVLLLAACSSSAPTVSEAEENLSDQYVDRPSGALISSWGLPDAHGSTGDGLLIEYRYKKTKQFVDNDDDDDEGPVPRVVRCRAQFFIDTDQDVQRVALAGDNWACNKMVAQGPISSE